MSKRVTRLVQKIADKVESSGIDVNEKTHQDLVSLLKSEDVSAYFERQLFGNSSLKQLPKRMHGA
jgi:putative transposon-encoded protein